MDCQKASVHLAMNHRLIIIPIPAISFQTTLFMHLTLEVHLPPKHHLSTSLAHPYSHLGWLQVQDPGSSPSHCTQDDEDPHLEADTEESVRLAQLVEKDQVMLLVAVLLGFLGAEGNELEPVSPGLFQRAVRNLCAKTGVETRDTKKMVWNIMPTVSSYRYYVVSTM